METTIFLWDDNHVNNHFHSWLLVLDAETSDHITFRRHHGFGGGERGSPGAECLLQLWHRAVSPKLYGIAPQTHNDISTSKISAPSVGGRFKKVCIRVLVSACKKPPSIYSHSQKPANTPVQQTQEHLSTS